MADEGRGFMYHPPWWDAERREWYGPTTTGAYEREIEDYELRGFWKPPRGVSYKRRQMQGHGYDLERMKRYAEANELPQRQLEVVLCLVQGLSVRGTAKKLKMDRGDVRRYARIVLKKSGAVAD